MRRLLTTAVAVALSASAEDFRNFTYPWRNPGGVPATWTWLTTTAAERLLLRDGSWRAGEDAGAAWVQLRSVTYGDLDGDGHDDAAVDLLYSTGGTANWHYVYVYSQAGGAPELLAVLRSGSRADGGLIRVAIERKLLILDFADPRRRIADCCSEGEVRVRYRWTGSRFVAAR